MMHIVGAGPAGAYFARLVYDEIPEGELKVYDQKPKTKCGIKPCAWVCYEKGIRNLLDDVYLDADDYILSRINKVEILGSKVRAKLCVIDKPKMINDLLEDIDVIEKHVTPKSIDNGFIVDATGHRRTMLPDTQNERIILPTCQMQLNTKLPNAITYSGGGGYKWVFDMGETSHIGCGYHDTDTFNGVKDSIFNIKSATCKCLSKICLSPPSECIPYVYLEPKKFTVGIGESIGTVSPLTGKGIEFAMESALILYNTMEINNYLPVVDISEYYRDIRRKFGSFNSEYRMLTSMLEGDDILLRDMYVFFKNAHKNGVYVSPLSIKRMLIEGFR